MLLGSIHCHSVFSDGHATPKEMLATAGRVGLDFLAITDHVPPSVDAALTAGFPGATADFPLWASGVVRVPGLEYSPPGGHYLVLGADPWEVPAPAAIEDWPGLQAPVRAVAGRPGALGFVAHPDDEGSRFLKVKSYPWRDWTVPGSYGLEIWNLSTDLCRTMRGYRDVLRAVLAGPYRAVPPPHPATLARWDSMAQCRRVIGVAGTDAHGATTRWHGIPLTVVPYDRAFESLQTGVWVDRETMERPPGARGSGIVEALARGRVVMVNRAWGHPLGFVFQARRLAGPGGPFVTGEVVPAGCPVRFEVAVPGSCWIRLIRNGVVVANTYGRELSLEPLPAAQPDRPAQHGRPVYEAWRAEAWVTSSHWSKAGAGFFPWILSNHIYREVD